MDTEPDYDTYIEVSTKMQLHHAFRALDPKCTSVVVFINPWTGSRTRFVINGQAVKIFYRSRISAAEKKAAGVPFYRDIDGIKETPEQFDARMIALSNRVLRSKANVWK